MATDEALLAAWRAGDNTAGDSLVERHFEGVCRFFRTKVDRDVDDLLQRTFARCVRAKERLRPDTTFRAFLYMAARNELVDHYRRERARSGAVVDASVHSVAALAPSPTSIIAKDEEQRLLIAALQRLPLDLQVALELFYWEDLTGPELAAVLGIAEGTVRSRLRRGVEALRQSIQQLAESPQQRDATLQSLSGWAHAVRALMDDA